MAARTDRSRTYPVPALEKGLDILEHLADEAVPRTQAELARALGRQPGELFRMLSALEARGYLRRDETSGAYALTLKLFEIGRTHSPFEALLRVASPVMRRLADAVGETCHISAINRDRVVVLGQEESPKPIRLSVEVGSRHPIASTTSGRLLVSVMAPEERERVLARCGVFERMPQRERAAFARRIKTISERGFEISEGERFLGSYDVGMVIGKASGQIRAALIIATLKRGDGSQANDLIGSLRAATDEITATVGLD